MDGWSEAKAATVARGWKLGGVASSPNGVQQRIVDSSASCPRPKGQPRPVGSAVVSAGTSGEIDSAW